MHKQSDTVYYSVEDLKKINPQQQFLFEGIFVVRKCSAKTARNGSNYFAMTLSDKTGSFKTNCFQDAPFFSSMSTLEEGSVIHIKGHTEYYQEQFSPGLKSLTPLDPSELDDILLSSLIAVSSEDPELLWEELFHFTETITHEPLKQTVFNVINELGDSFKYTPGALIMHHAYRSGLLEHTVHLLRAAEALLPLYQEVDHDLAIAGLILHDVGKTQEYEGTLAYTKSRKGKLYGHVVLGYRMTRQAALRAQLEPDYLERLEHIILSHQGELEWGAAVLPSSPEAVFVSMVDNLDAKMGAVQSAIRNTSPEKSFSDYLPALKSSILVEPLHGEKQDS